MQKQCDYSKTLALNIFDTAGKMTQKVKVLAAKPNYLSSIPRTHVIDKKATTPAPLQKISKCNFKNMKGLERCLNV